MKAPTQQAAPAATKTLAAPRGGLLLQRRCACGESAGLTGACEECGGKQLAPRRSSTGQPAPASAPPVIPDEAPDAPGLAPDAPERLWKESRLGHDFGQTRVLRDAPPPVQTRLIVGRPGDAYEQEADRVAAQVVGMAEPPGRAPDSPVAGHAPPSIQRACASCESKDDDEGVIIRAKSVGDSAPVPTLEFGASLHAARGGGRPLSEDVRGFFEPRFGHDFSRVRIHTGEGAARMARSVEARAFTAGHDIFFGAGQYDPSGAQGRKLLAHELTHVVQQAPHIARQPEDAPPAKCDQGHRLGEILKPPVTIDGKVYTYRVWGTPKEGESTREFASRLITGWIPWRFGALSADLRRQMYTLAMSDLTIASAYPPSTKCQYFLPVEGVLLQRLRVMSGEVAREREAAKKKREEEEARKAEAAKAQETPAPAGGGAGAEPKAGEEAAPPPAAPGEKKEQTPPPAAANGGGPAQKDEQKKEQKQGGGGLGALEGAVEEAKRLSSEPVSTLRRDWAVLADSKLAANYLDVLQHYAGRAVTPEDTAAASDGLTEEELEKIVAGKPLLRVLTDLYTQGYAEFRGAGGSDQEKFFRLEELIMEQFTRGNPTATHNNLRIGYGIPEKDILGIVERNSGILYYDDRPLPLPGLGGIGVRDKGYVATRPDNDTVLINIAAIEDPALRLFLTSLTQTFRDPIVMSMQAADFYFHNIELVNAEVQKGLGAETWKKFQEMLPFFIGFLAGHAVSNFFMRVPNPVVAKIGLALKGLLIGAGYVLQIEFGAGALAHLHEAAYHLTRIEMDDQKKMTRLSEKHLAAAATPLRGMVADIALMFATGALSKILRAVQKGQRKARIDCTECEIKGEGGEKLAEGKAEAAGPKAAPAPRPPEVTAAITRAFDKLGFDKLPPAQQQRIKGKLEALLELRKDDQLGALKELEPTIKSPSAFEAWLDFHNAGRAITGRPNTALQAELKGALSSARGNTKVTRGTSSSGDVTGGTVAVAKSDLPQLKGLYEGASGQAGGKMPAKPAFKPPSSHGTAQGHAEHHLAEQFNSILEGAIAADKSKTLTPGSITGKIWIHVEQAVCSTCRAGSGPGSEAGAGVLRQFSLKFPKITIEITAEGTAEIFVIRNGVRIFGGGGGGGGGE